MSLSFVGIVNLASNMSMEAPVQLPDGVGFDLGFTGGEPTSRARAYKCSICVPCCSGSASWHQYRAVPGHGGVAKGNQAPLVYDACFNYRGACGGGPWVTRANGSADEQVNSNSPISMTRFERGDKSDVRKAMYEKRKENSEK